MIAVDFKPVRVALAEDREGRLAFVDGSLVGVLVLLSELHGQNAGSWFLEVGFGDLDGPNRPVFSDLEAAQAWISDRLPFPPPSDAGLA